MNKKIILFFLATLCLMCGCETKSIRLEGEISEADGRYLVVTRIGPDATEVIDSVLIKKGNFKLSIPTEDAEPAFYCLSLSDENAFTTLARRGDKLTLSAKGSSLVKTYHLTGSEDVQLMENLDRQLTHFADSVEILREWFESSYNDTLHAQIEKAYLQIKENHTAFLRSFITKNMHSLACLPAFYQCYDNAIFFDEQHDLALLEQMLTSLNKKYPDNVNVKWLEKEVRNSKAVQSVRNE